MRSLFILLVLLNVSYLIWGVAFSEKKQPEVPQELTQSMQMLTLLSEKPEEIVPRGGAEPSSNVKTPNSDSKSEAVRSRACFSLGPFFEDDQIKVLEAKLKKDGFNTTRKSITDKEPKSYWVYLPAAKTMGEAKLTAEELRAANVKDYFVIRTGKNARAISLGLYNGYNRAKIRKSDLIKLGFKPIVKTRYRQVTRHWLDFQETSSKRLKVDVWKHDDKDIVLQKIARPCVDPLPATS